MYQAFQSASRDGERLPITFEWVPKWNNRAIDDNMGVMVALGLDVPNFTKDVPNFTKDVPNFIKDVPRVPKYVLRWGMASNHFGMGSQIN